MVMSVYNAQPVHRTRDSAPDTCTAHHCSNQIGALSWCYVWQASQHSHQVISQTEPCGNITVPAPATHQYKMDRYHICPPSKQHTEPAPHKTPGICKQPLQIHNRDTPAEPDLAAGPGLTACKAAQTAAIHKQSHSRCPLAAAVAAEL